MRHPLGRCCFRGRCHALHARAEKLFTHCVRNDSRRDCERAKQQLVQCQSQQAVQEKEAKEAARAAKLAREAREMTEKVQNQAAAVAQAAAMAAERKRILKKARAGSMLVFILLQANYSFYLATQHR